MNLREIKKETRGRSKRGSSALLSFAGLVASVFAASGIAFAVTADVEGAFSPAASWIGAKGRFFHYNTRKEMRTAAIYAKDFELAARPRVATLKISVAGYWDIRVNGRQITEDVLMPTPSNFDRRVYMKDYDIAPFLVPGANRIEVTLGNSIYNCPTEGAWMQDTITWRDDPQLICEIVADGNVVAASDGTWRVHLDGPVRTNSIRCGETYDARKETLSPEGWEEAVKKHGPGGVIVRERHPPTRIWKRLAAKKIGDDLWDARQNLAGFVEIKVRGEAGAMVTIRTREELGKNGKIAAGSSFVSGGEFQCDRYILKGGGEETWHPRFSYGGFRYIEATVSDGAAEILGVTACAVGSDLKEKPFPAPANPALSNLLERAKWSIRSNMVGFPTDCPSREKQGWTGDALSPRLNDPSSRQKRLRIAARMASARFSWCTASSVFPKRCANRARARWSSRAYAEVSSSVGMLRAGLVQSPSPKRTARSSVSMPSMNAAYRRAGSYISRAMASSPVASKMISGMRIIAASHVGP